MNDKQRMKDRDRIWSTLDALDNDGSHEMRANIYERVANGLDRILLQQRDELTALRAENNLWRAVTGVDAPELYDRLENDAITAIITHSEMAAVIKRLRGALAFYADRDHYDWRVHCPTGDLHSSRIDDDKGEIAREALEGSDNAS